MINVRVKEFEEVATDVRIRFETDYVEFFKARRRWKTDFESATKNVETTFSDLD
jgi:hypothetical protein